VNSIDDCSDSDSDSDDSFETSSDSRPDSDDSEEVQQNSGSSKNLLKLSENFNSNTDLCSNVFWLIRFLNCSVHKLDIF
jgi:hypothetical protein